MIERVRENRIMKKVLEFIGSDKFIFFATFLTVLANAFSLEFVAWSVAFLVGAVSILFSKDLRAILPIAMLSGFSISRANNTKGVLSVLDKGDYFLLEDPKGYITIAVFGGILLILLLVRIFALGDFKKMKSKKYTFKYALLSLAVALLIAGLTKRFFDFKNITSALIMILSTSACYFLLLGTIDFKDLPFSYFAKFFFSFAFVSAFSVIVVYLKHFDEISKVVDGVLQIQRGAIGTGWGGQNTISVVFLMSVPFGFYLALTEKRGYIYSILIILTYIITCLNLSRTLILFGGIFLLIGFIILLIKSKKRLQHLIVVLALLATVSIIGIVFFDKLKGLFGLLIERGFIYSDRLKLMQYGIEAFKESPILGVGYIYCDPAVHFKGAFGKYHNIFVDILASSGIIGLILLILHFALVIKNGFRKKGSFITTILAVGALVLVSCFDRFFFIPPIMLFYSVFLLIMEGYKEKNEE